MDKVELTATRHISEREKGGRNPFSLSRERARRLEVITEQVCQPLAVLDKDFGKHAKTVEKDLEKRLILPQPPRPVVDRETALHNGLNESGSTQWIQEKSEPETHAFVGTETALHDEYEDYQTNPYQTVDAYYVDNPLDNLVLTDYFKPEQDPRIYLAAQNLAIHLSTKLRMAMVGSEPTSFIILGRQIHPEQKQMVDFPFPDDGPFFSQDDQEGVHVAKLTDKKDPRLKVISTFLESLGAPVSTIAPDLYQLPNRTDEKITAWNSSGEAYARISYPTKFPGIHVNYWYKVNIIGEEQLPIINPNLHKIEIQNTPPSLPEIIINGIKTAGISNNNN